MKTTPKERAEVAARLYKLGFSPIEADSLRRIALTLHRWHELECGDGYRMIQRDEKTGIPYCVNYSRSYLSANDPRTRYRVADRERGALARLRAIMSRHDRRHLFAYVQTDPRGASLYIGKRSALKRYGGNPDACYSSAGVPVY